MNRQRRAPDWRYWRTHSCLGSADGGSRRMGWNVSVALEKDFEFARGGRRYFQGGDRLRRLLRSGNRISATCLWKQGATMPVEAVEPTRNLGGRLTSEMIEGQGYREKLRTVCHRPLPANSTTARSKLGLPTIPLVA